MSDEKMSMALYTRCGVVLEMSMKINDACFRPILSRMISIDLYISTTGYGVLRVVLCDSELFLIVENRILTKKRIVGTWVVGRTRVEKRTTLTWRQVPHP
jgi:hypothetical protein